MRSREKVPRAHGQQTVHQSILESQIMGASSTSCFSAAKRPVRPRVLVATCPFTHIVVATRVFVPTSQGERVPEGTMGALSCFDGRGLSVEMDEHVLDSWVLA